MREDREAFLNTESLSKLIVEPKANELFIDIDNEEQCTEFERRYAILARHIDIDITYDEPSISGKGHRHIIVSLPEDINHSERVCLQSLLGSDPVRELLSYIRIKAKQPKPIIFFERKERTNETETQTSEEENEFDFI